MPAEAVCRHKNMVDGNPRKIPRMGTLSGIGHPSSVALPSRQPDRPHSETGTGEPQERLRVDASFHQFRSPFWEGHGVFWRADGGPAWTRAPRSGGKDKKPPTRKYPSAERRARRAPKAPSKIAASGGHILLMVESIKSDARSEPPRLLDAKTTKATAPIRRDRTLAHPL